MRAIARARPSVAPSRAVPTPRRGTIAVGRAARARARVDIDASHECANARRRVVVARAATSDDASDDANETSGMAKVKAWWRDAAKIDKKKIASLGSAALLSYGFVSNVFYVTSLMLATYTAVKTTGASPLVNSLSMKTFASSYFGLWMIQNFLRPARFASVSYTHLRAHET